MIVSDVLLDAPLPTADCDERRGADWMCGRCVVS